MEHRDLKRSIMVAIAHLPVPGQYRALERDLDKMEVDALRELHLLIRNMDSHINTIRNQARTQPWRIR